MGILGLYFLGIFKFLGLSVIPIESGKTSNNVPYICPNSASECSVRGVMECNIPTDTQICSSCTINKNSLLLSPNNYLNTEIQMCPSGTCGISNCFKGCRGGTSYSCTGSFKQTDKNGLNIVNQNLVYSKSIQGQIATDYIILKTGEKASITGGNSNYIEYSSNFYSECDYNQCSDDSLGIAECKNHRLILNNIIPCSSGKTCTGGITANATCEKIAQCSADACNSAKTGWNECLNGQIYTYHPCDVDNGYECDSASCTFPFTTKNVLLVDENRISKSGFTSSESIKISSKLISNKINSGSVNFKVWREGDNSPLKNYKIDNYDFQSGQTIYTDIINPNSNGLYYVTVDLSYNNKVVPLVADKSISFRIAPSISCSINIVSPSQSSTFINYPVWIEVNTYNNIGASTIDNINLDVKFKGNTLYIDPTSYEKPPIESEGTVTYKFIKTFSTVGLLDVSAIVTKNNVQSQTCSMTGKQIQDNKVISSYTNLDRLQCIPTSNQRITFETEDSLSNYIDTTNTLQATDQNGATSDISSSVVRDSTGHYHFDYNFVSSVGGNAYSFKLNSFSDVYNIGSEPLTGTIESRTDCSVKECTQNTDCSSKGSNYVCTGGKCVTNTGPNWLLYIGLTFGAVMLLIVLIFIIKFIKKPKQDIYGL